MKAAGHKVLLVDDEVEFCRVIASILEAEGFSPVLAHDGKTAVQKVRLESPEVVITDVRLPDIDGLEVLQQVKKLDPDLPVVLITGHAGIPQAVEAMRAMAHDYLAKPFEAHELIRVVHRAVAERELRLKLKKLEQRINVNRTLTDIMGPSDAVKQLVVEVNLVARSDFNVILIGETGSGKEVVARAIHQASHRSRRPFVPVDCGAIPETLVEGELFGYEKGAFTGAVSAKRGKFELAEGGTLFLDEILNLPLGSQAKLLRALQEKTISHLGGVTPRAIDVRVLVAANQNLEAAAGSGKFRVDLFFRLNEFLVRIPPLRERKEDIMFLAKRFLDLTNAELNKTVQGFSQGAVDALLDFAWPGNVRQLRSTIRRAVLVADDIVTKRHLDIAPNKGEPAPATEIPATSPNMAGGLLSLKLMVAGSIATVERAALIKALRRVHGNKAHAARLLQIDYKTMQSKIKKYGITTDKNDSDENQAQTEQD